MSKILICFFSAPTLLFCTARQRVSSREPSMSAKVWSGMVWVEVEKCSRQRKDYDFERMWKYKITILKDCCS